MIAAPRIQDIGQPTVAVTLLPKSQEHMEWQLYPGLKCRYSRVAMVLSSGECAQLGGWWQPWFWGLCNSNSFGCGEGQQHLPLLRVCSSDGFWLPQWGKLLVSSKHQVTEVHANEHFGASHHESCGEFVAVGVLQS